MNHTNNIAQDLTKEERKKLKLWQEQYALNADKLKGFIEGMEEGNLDLSGYNDYNTNTAWQKVSTEAGLRDNKFNWMRIAAAIAVLLFVGFGVKELALSDDSFVQKEYVNQEEFSFPDGSFAHIDSGSKLSFKETGFGDERKLDFEGRALFKVQASAEKTFTINTDDFDVQVLGTEFEVNTIDGFKSVKVIEGKVRVSTMDNEVILGANQIAKVKGNKIYVADLNVTNNIKSWSNNILIFNDASIQQVINDLSNHFNKSFQIDESTVDLNCSINTEFRNESLDSVLEELRLNFGAVYKIDGHIVSMSNIACDK